VFVEFAKRETEDAGEFRPHGAHRVAGGSIQRDRDAARGLDTRERVVLRRSPGFDADPPRAVEALPHDDRETGVDPLA
jgi:hypothetical protein